MESIYGDITKFGSGAFILTLVTPGKLANDIGLYFRVFSVNFNKLFVNPYFASVLNSCLFLKGRLPSIDVAPQDA